MKIMKAIIHNLKMPDVISFVLCLKNHVLNILCIATGILAGVLIRP
jgi:hypothetical protein